MGERDFAGTRIGAPAYERDGGGAVMRRAKGARGPVAHVEGFGRHGEDGRCLDRLFFVHRRQKAGEAVRKHRLAGAGRADHEEVVATARRDLQSTFGAMLAAHIGHVAHPVRRSAASRRDMRRKGRVPFQMPVHFEQASRGEYARIAHQTGCTFVAGGQNERPPRLSRAQCARQRPAPRAQRPR